MQEYDLVEYRGSYALYWRDESGPRRRSLGTADRKEALALKAEIERLEAIAASDHVTVDEAWEFYRKYLGDRPAAKRMPSVWKQLKRVFGGLLPANVTEQHSKDYIALRRKDGRKDGTILTELNQLGTCFNWNVKRKKIPAAPLLVFPQRPEPKTDYLTRDQVRKIVDACKFRHIKLFVVLAITTGARMGAILDLTWDRIDFERRQIDLRLLDPNRSRKGRAVVPMNDTAYTALLAAKDHARSRYVIEWAGQKVGSVKKALWAAGTAAGINHNVHAHLFRHSAAVWMAEADTPMSVIAQYLGHEDERVTFRIYARYSPKYLAGAAQALEL